MSSNQKHSVHLMLTTIFFGLIVLAVAISLWINYADFAKYDDGEVVMVKIESKPKVGKFTYAVYGAYSNGGDREYTRVEMKNCETNRVGEIVACKVMPGKPHYVCKVGVKLTPKMGLKYIILAVALVCAGLSGYSLYRHNSMMEDGLHAVATIKSTVEREGLFFGLVEFTDSTGMQRLAEICFEQKMVVRGQRCNIKYQIHENGVVEAYYFDVRREGSV